MSSKSFLQMLEAGKVDEFNQNRPPFLDLFAADLSNAQLAGVDFSNVKLEKADLTDANLEGANLTKTRFSGADMTGINCKSVTAHHAKFDEIYAENADFSHADLSGAVFNESELIDSNFNRAVLENGQFKQADLQNCNFQDAELIRSNFTNSHLKKCEFSQADLAGSRLNKSLIQDSNFTHAVLRNANLSQADIQKSDFHQTNLSRADLSNAEIENIDFSNAITEEIAANLGVFSLPKPPPAPHVFIEEPLFAISQEHLALIWINHESPNKQLRLIRSKIGDEKPTISAIPSPVDLLLAKSLISIDDGFVCMCIEDRPSGKYALFYHIPINGPVNAFCRLQLPHQLAGLYNRNQLPNFKLCTTKNGLILYVIARNAPKIRVHLITYEGKTTTRAFDLPTVNGLLGHNEAIALTKGGTLAVLSPRGPVDMLSCPTGFPGRKCDVIMNQGQGTVAWLSPLENEDAMPKLGVFVSSVEDDALANRLHRKALIRQLSLCCDADEVWLSYMISPMGFEPAEVWIAQAQGIARYQLNTTTDGIEEDIDHIFGLSSTDRAYLAATSLNGAVFLYHLQDGGAVLVQNIG